MKNTNLYLCTFSDINMILSAKRLYNQAIDMNVFKDIFVYNELNLSLDFKNDFKDKLVPSRGFGYWCWKPYIILECLKKIKYNDILLYLDVGCHLNNKATDIFNDYIKITEMHDALFFALKEEDGFIEKNCTKSDLFEYFNVLDEKSITDTEQIMSGVIFLKKTDKNIDFIKKWLDVYYDNFSVIDDSPSKIKNPDSFMYHRHDQSVFSILINKFGFIKMAPEVETIDMKYPIQTRRDKVKLDKVYSDDYYVKSIISELNKSIDANNLKVAKITRLIPIKKWRTQIRNKYLKSRII